MNCPSCGTPGVVSSDEEELFPYGVSPNTVVLRALVPVRSCGSCHFEFTDHEADEIRDATVKRHLEVEELLSKTNSPT